MANSFAAASANKRKRGLDLEYVQRLFEVDPDDYQVAWNDLKTYVTTFQARPMTTLPLSPSTLTLPEALKIFNLRHTNDILWSDIDLLPVPQYLLDSIARVEAVTTSTYNTNEAFSRTILDLILVSALYEENQPGTAEKSAKVEDPAALELRSAKAEDPAVLELRHETQLQRTVIYGGEPRLLSGYADYTVWYEPAEKAGIATNLIIIEAKKRDSTDTCMGQLASYMGLVHATRKDQGKQNCVVYGAASDGCSFRFCRIDNEGNWNRSRLLEWATEDTPLVYSIFRSLIRIAALSSPSTSPIKNVQKRARVLASFGSPERTRKFHFDLGNLRLLEEDEDTEIIGGPVNSL